MPEPLTVTLGDLASSGHLEIGDGYRTKRSEHGTPGLPILRVAEVLDGRIEPEYSDFVSDRYRSAMGSKISQPGDVILTTKGTVGRVAIVPSDGPEFVYSPQVCYFRIRGKGPIASRYLYYWFKSEGFWSQARSLKGQTDMADYINLADIRSLNISIPTQSTQAALIEVLGALDDKIAVNDRIADTALKLALAEYERWRDLGQLTRLESMAGCGRWLSGGTPNTSTGSYWDGDIPWISASSLKSPWIYFSDRMITQLGAVNGTRIVPRETVIFVVRGMSLVNEFRVGLTQREVAFGQDCKAILPSAEIDATVLFIAIKSRTPDILGLVDSAGHGTGRLATDLLSKMTLELPGADFCETAAGALRPLVGVGAERQAENRNLRELRDTLLPKLMSGEIRVRDAEKVVEKVT